MLGTLIEKSNGGLMCKSVLLHGCFVRQIILVVLFLHRPYEHCHNADQRDDRQASKAQPKVADENRRRQNDLADDITSLKRTIEDVGRGIGVAFRRQTTVLSLTDVGVRDNVTVIVSKGNNVTLFEIVSRKRNHSRTDMQCWLHRTGRNLVDRKEPLTHREDSQGYER
jgi:hypothetical protein